MTIEEIIALIQNQGTIADGLANAEGIPFSEADRSLFEMKRVKYAAGMTDYEKVNWIQEMTAFLHRYRTQYGSYQSDPLKSWHHFDKRELKRNFDRLSRSSGHLKVLFIEYDDDPLSYQVHEILFSHHNSAQQNTEPAGTIKGGTDSELDLSDDNYLDRQWSDFMRNVFGISKAVSVSDGFRDKNFGAQTHFVVQKIYRFNADNFDRYYALWKTLSLEEPLFLFLYVDPDVIESAPSGESILHCPCDMHSVVKKEDFTLFYARHGHSYKEDLTLCRCNPMPFRDALERLQFCELDY
jgi:hypothetical protein